MRKRKNESKFNPNREYINKAVDEYLKRGGQIKKVKEYYYDIPESYVSKINYIKV